MIFGGLFNCVLTYSGDLIVTGVTQPMKESFAHPIRRVYNVIHAAAGGRDLSFVTIDGNVGMILGSDPNEVTTINYPQ